MVFVFYILQIHSLLMCYYPQLLNGLSNMTPSKHLAILTQKLLKCLGDHQITTFRPVTLSLSVISHELEQITPNWLSIVMMIQQMTEVRTAAVHVNTSITYTHYKVVIFDGILPNKHDISCLSKTKWPKIF